MFVIPKEPKTKTPRKGFKLHRLDNGPATTVTVTKDEAIKYYSQMQMIRRLETQAGNLYKEKIIRGFCHLYSGQEACAVGKSTSINSNKSRLKKPIPRYASCYDRSRQHNLRLQSPRLDLLDGSDSSRSSR